MKARGGERQEGVWSEEQPGSLSFPYADFEMKAFHCKEVPLPHNL